ncbi:MAG: DUF4398 domain-containing protein [Candidatus Hatepunaea meridiana]|nr:DUF4398 domain-containing protein [Candidatus Hatepunaea meridiana]
MKFSSILSLILVAFVASLLFSACEGPPDDAVMDAEDAIKAAVASGAEDLSPKLLDKAQKLLQEAKMLSEQGRYKDAFKQAQFCIVRAKSAKKNAERLGGGAPESSESDTSTEP